MYMPKKRFCEELSPNDLHALREYFPANEWDRMSGYEKGMYHVVKTNYEQQLAEGKPAPMPEFMTRIRGGTALREKPKLESTPYCFGGSVDASPTASSSALMPKVEVHSNVSDFVVEPKVCIDEVWTPQLTSLMNPPIFTCQDCGQAFTNFDLWATHMNTHSAPFVCEVCQADFTHRGDFKSHRRGHFLKVKGGKLTANQTSQSFGKAVPASSPESNSDPVRVSVVSLNADLADCRKSGCDETGVLNSAPVSEGDGFGSIGNAGHELLQCDVDSDVVQRNFEFEPAEIDDQKPLYDLEVRDDNAFNEKPSEDGSDMETRSLSARVNHCNVRSQKRIAPASNQHGSQPEPLTLSNRKDSPRVEKSNKPSKFASAGNSVSGMGLKWAQKAHNAVEISKSHRSVGQRQRVKCNECNKAFSSSVILERHVKQFHPAPAAGTHRRALEALILKLQRKYFKKSSSDQKTKHPKQTRNPEKTRNPGKRKNPEMTENPRTPFKSAPGRKAPAAHPATTKYRQHLRCQICGRTFAQSHQLKRHEQVHSARKRYPCDRCEKSFAENHALTLHRRTIHDGERPFVCAFCPANFGAKKSRRRHQRIHESSGSGSENSAGPLLSCEKCGWMFTCVGPLKHHIMYFHGDVT